MTSRGSRSLCSQRLHLFERVTRALYRASGFERTVRATGECLVPGFADDSRAEREREAEEDWIEVVHSDPAEEAKRRPGSPPSAACAPAGREEGRRAGPRVSAGFPSSPLLPRVSSDRETVGLPLVDSTCSVQSLMVVPLRSGRHDFRSHGPTSHPWSEPYHARDLSAAQVIARRSAVAIQGSELHDRLGNEEARRYRLEDTLQKWIRVFDRARWGAAIVDAEDQRIEAVNPAFAALHGYPTPDSLSGRLFSDLLPADRADEPAGWRSQSNPPVYESLHRPGRWLHLSGPDQRHLDR